MTRNAALILAISIDERLQRAAEFRRQIVFLDRVEQRDGRLVGFQLRDAARACGQVTFESRVHLGRKVMLDEIREKPDEIVAAAFLWHGQYQLRFSPWGRSNYPNPKRRKPETNAGVWP